MSINSLLDQINTLRDVESLRRIASAAAHRYRLLLAEKTRAAKKFSAGDAVSFHLNNGEKIHGIIQRRGRKNFKILAENGTIYRVPFHLAQQEQQTPAVFAAVANIDVHRLAPFVLGESRRLLHASGIELPVRFKKNVWATHFRADRHIQFGEKCLAYQLMPGSARDNIGANLRKFHLPPDSASRLAMLVIHEVAHAIAHHRYGPQILPHGRQFYNVLAELVDSEFHELHRGFRQQLRKIDSPSIHAGINVPREPEIHA